jgi:hypothetical protein
MNNRKSVRCEVCGSRAELQVVPDDWNDAPASFTITRECTGGCGKTYTPCTPQRMQELTGLPLTGWSS